MALKDIFGSSNKGRNLLGSQTEKDAFKEVESSRNLQQLKLKQDTYMPRVDYSEPSKFAKFGSANLYYKSAIERIINFYPYDGSDAELNAFYNNSLDIEKYIFNERYPRTTGYINLSANGYGSVSAIKVPGTSASYGIPATAEYITFHGGPNVADSNSNVKDMIADPMSSKFQSNNIYNTDIYTRAGLASDYGSGTRESNLKSDFDNGVTIEFWAKTGSLAPTLTGRQVIFDMWNNEASSSDAYGRIILELTATLDAAASSVPAAIFLTAQSGAVSASAQSIITSSIGQNLDFNSWAHYAVSLYNSGSNFIAKLYVNGDLNDTNTYSSINLNELQSKNMMGRIGGLLSAPSASAGGVTDPSSYIGGGKLSGSLDEFRFWKVTRDASQIGKHWFTQIRGGVNTDISNTELGMYYKFNEGILNSSTTDSVVLDYGGRLCNGTWTGYAAGSGSETSRNTGSAIVSASAAIKEYLDPIIYAGHSEVTALKEGLLNSGSHWDHQNSSLFKGLFPSWVLEEDDKVEESDLERMCHIIGAYFDKLYLQISAVPGFKHHKYPSGSTAIPFAQHMPQSLGLYTPDLFIDASVLEKFTNRNERELFEGELHEIKNGIYTNLYNNLANIYKAKGTERAIRNTLRCFNLDDSLVVYNVYSNNQLYELKNNLKQTLKKKIFANFNNSGNTKAVIHQAIDPHSASVTRGYISGSESTHGYENRYGMTTEVGVTFPRFFRALDMFDRDFTQVSLFGVETVQVNSSSVELADTAFLSGNLNVANFQVYAIRDEKYSKNAYFQLTSAISPHPFVTLTSSTFLNVYDNSNWNFSVRIKPSNYPLADNVSGSETYTYDVIFTGKNNNLGTIQNSFTATGSITQLAGQQILNASKRLYVGARNTNITGSNLYKSDVLISNAKYWTTYIDDYTLQQHTFDLENAGLSGSYRHLSPLDLTSSQSQYFNTLALDWYFSNVTGSDASGNFYTTDISSGSALIRDNFAWVGKTAGHLHTGKGAGFATSSANVVKKDLVNEFKFIDPERVVASEQVKILTEDDKIFGTFDQIPNYIYTIEKSLYAAISEEILDFFAGAVDFNHLIGQPVNRYRSRYKMIESLRRIFFEKFQNIKTVEKFTEYYKWFDDALALIIKQLVPASSDFIDDVYNMVESHTLERNKYKSQYPTIEFKVPDPEGSLGGIFYTGGSVDDALVDAPSYLRRGVPRWYEDMYGGEEASPRPVKKHLNYWLKRAIPAGRGTGSVEIASGIKAIDDIRKKLRGIAWSRRVLSSSIGTRNTINNVGYKPDAKLANQLGAVYSFNNPTIQRTIKGGVNFEPSKDIGYVYSALYPFGPVYTAERVFVPQNVLTAFATDMTPLKDLTLRNEKRGYHTDDANPPYKTKRHLGVYMGRDYNGGLGYENIKNSIVFPFNIMSSSVVSGYNKLVVDKFTSSVEITNLHNDVYGPDMEKPMQGTFTEHVVGGHQSRHVALNTGTDDYTTRPEAWKLLLGKCVGITGAIGMVGPDYPWPEANEIDALPYPMTASQKAVYYRNVAIKRPVNIRNIQIRTGSTILGNYRRNYEIVHTVGAWSNPKKFVENNSTMQLPTEAFQNSSTSSTQIRSFLDIHRDSDSHFKFVDEYPTAYLSGGTKMDSVISSKFSNPGGLEVSSIGYRDFRSNEFSVYNALTYRNLTVIKPSQGPSGSISEATGAGGPGIRVGDIHGYDYGLRSHLARHTARFGRDSLWVTGASSVFQASDLRSGAPGAQYDQLPGFHKVHRNHRPRIRIVGSSSHNPIIPESEMYASASSYDNFYVQHQIPRSDRQYAWITGAIVHSEGLRYYGLMPTAGTYEGMYSSSAGGIESYMPWVSASEFGSIVVVGNRVWGYDRSYAGSVVGSFVPTAFGNLNTNIYEPITTTAPSGSNMSYMNTLGYATGATIQGYANYPSFLDLVNVDDQPTLFNAIMLKRNGIYGWGTFNQSRQSDHPVLRAERKNNKLSLVKSGSSIDQYDLRPVSMKGRPVYANYDYNTYTTVRGVTNTTTANATLKTSYNNELIYFNQPSLNDYLDIDPHTDNEVTTFEQLMALKSSRDYTLNWVHYTECVFPSMKNEFSTTSSFRNDYDNKYWRTHPQDRLAVGSYLSNSVGVWWSQPAAGSEGRLSQSSWPLDASQDFLTRAGPPSVSTIDQSGALPFWDSLKNSGSAGELQNTYGWWHAGMIHNTSSDSGWETLTEGLMLNTMSPGALYARKHTLASPNSIMSPGQMKGLHPIGAYPAGFEFAPGQAGSSTSSLGSGEAYWDAPATAGYLTQSINTDSNNTSGSMVVGFVSASSEPWFNNYSEFKADLKLKARGYSVVPEFRISEKVESYLQAGTAEGFNMLEIPGTDRNSSEDSFYIDYSNSDFMNNFLDIRQMSDLPATEFKLTCKAAIRFNPYKGFYPAQRTLDLVSQFSRSFGNSIIVDNNLGWAAPLSGAIDPASRIIYQPLFAPGILYNSIKSGIACDWPIISEEDRTIMGKYNFTGSHLGLNGQNWALYPLFHSDEYSQNGLGARFQSGSIWTTRLPFETIIDPGVYMNGLSLTDMEPHPSCSLDWAITASLASTTVDNVYSLMASNFVAEVGNFFLKDATYTKLSSNASSLDKVRFSGKSGEVYGARLRLKNSFEGERTYQYESCSAADNSWFSLYGAVAFNAAAISPFSGSETAGSGSLKATGSFEIPQDPQYNPNFNRNFVMYSRTTAFGPPLSGRIPGPIAQDSDPTRDIPASASASGTMDCFNGYNWAFTPPHQHGEAWADIIFRPSGNVDYDLERILAEAQVVRWRHDPGPAIGKEWPDRGIFRRSLVSDSPSLAAGDFKAIMNKGVYNSFNTNKNAMQLDDSVNIFGIEEVYKQNVDKFGRVISTENEVVGKKWVIQPKFETPMLNFSDRGVHAITGSGDTKTLPSYHGADTAANGMWHQFGVMPDTTNKGIFLDIGDIPTSWLQNHYSVVSESSPYNNDIPSSEIYKQMQSFTKLMGFSSDNSRTRLGELADKQTVKEAIVAIPYITQNMATTAPAVATNDATYAAKKFINIPQARYEAATSAAEGSAEGDSLDAAGVSIRNLIRKMNDYVLPQQFDFIQNPLVGPIVMYMFEFKYSLNKDDLSYIWQNLAPRDYKKMYFQTEAVAHELFNTELLTEQNIMENPNLRWMVFKVKQKSQALYKDLRVRQVSEAGSTLLRPPPMGYPLKFNWPYDYLSIVELVKIEAEVLYKADTNTKLASNLNSNQKYARINATLDRTTRVASSAGLSTSINETAKVEEKKVAGIVATRSAEIKAEKAIKNQEIGDEAATNRTIAEISSRDKTLKKVLTSGTTTTTTKTTTGTSPTTTKKY